MVQQRKYYFQGVPNQMGKLQKFLGVSGIPTRNPWKANSKGWRGLKQKCPLLGGGGMDIFLNYTMHIVHS